MSALNMDVKTHYPLGRPQPSQDCMFKWLKQKNTAFGLMTESQKFSSSGRAVYQAICGGGRRWLASLWASGDPEGSGGPSLRLGMHPDCQSPVSSFVKQTGDVTVDYAGVKENIRLKYIWDWKIFLLKNGVVWETDVLRGLAGGGCKFPSISDTEAGGLQWSQDRASWKTSLMLHPLNSLETPSKGESRPTTKCVN